MSAAVDNFLEIVRARLLALDTSVHAVEIESRLPADAIRNILRPGSGKAGPTLARTAEICAALGLEMYIGPPRETGTVLTANISGAEFSSVPRFDATFSAGPGSENFQEHPAGAVAFRNDWLAREGISAASAIVVSVNGESMQPTLHDGDMVLIDRRRTVPRDRKIYALVGPDGDARVKRLEKLPDMLLLHSDNPKYQTEVISANDANRVRILGEVVWWGHTVR